MTGPWTYLWEFGDLLTSTEENPVHTYAEPGEYTIKFYVYNGECMDSVTNSVEIRPRPPVAAFAVPDSGCTPHEITMVNQSQWTDSYLWTTSYGDVSRLENPTFKFWDPGEVTISLEATGPGGTDRASYTLSVWETPYLDFSSYPDSVFVKDRPVAFFSLVTGADYYLWDFGDYQENGDPTPGNFSSATDTARIYYTEGWKDVKLVAWNDYCIDSLIREEAVLVKPKGQLDFPNVFKPSPGGPGSGVIDPNTPLDAGQANSVFFPGIYSQVAEYDLFIYNRWGELIFHSNKPNIGWDGYIGDQLAAQGVYFWKVQVVYNNGVPDEAVGDVTLLHEK
jgi:gliding motility-associated-like protein